MKKRVFLAIDLPLAQKEAVSELVKNLESLHLPINWEPPEKLHITLNFLGRLETDVINTLATSCLTKVCRRHNSFSLSLSFLERMYQRHEPSFIYLAPAGDIQSLTELQADLTTELANRQLPVQHRFMPHVTIGKLEKSDPVTTKQRLDDLSDIGMDPFLPFMVTSVTLFESHLSRAGSHFSVLRTFPLATS